MTISLMLLIAAGSMMSCATRLKLIPRLGGVSHTVAVPSHDIVQLSPVKSAIFPQVWMQMETASDRTWKAITRNTVVGQAFPPCAVQLDGTSILRDWAEWLSDPAREKAGYYRNEAIDLFADALWTQSILNAGSLVSRNSASQGKVTYQSRAPKQSRDEAMALHKIRDVIAEAAAIVADVESGQPFQVNHLWDGRLEMVGLIPNEVEIPSLQSGSAADDASVLALGLFLREKIQDDARGSFRKSLKALGYERQWIENCLWAPKKQFNVFAITGLAAKPGLGGMPQDLQMHELLLSKILKYAEKEQRIVVVPHWARQSSNGSDLSEYYVRLGFKEVALGAGFLELSQPMNYSPGTILVHARDSWVDNYVSLGDMVRMDL